MSSLTIVKPEAAKFDVENRYSTLIFDPEKSIAPTGRYLMRGGICFPTLCDDGVTGHAIMTGTNIKTNITYVFEEYKFVCIDHILKEDQTIEHHGLSQFLNRVWNDYFAKSYFFNQDYTTQKRYRSQIHRSDMIEPKPMFLELTWKDDSQSINAIFEKESFHRLFYRKKGEIMADMQKYSAKTDAFLPALHALKCAINGLEIYRIKDMANG